METAAALFIQELETLTTMTCKIPFGQTRGPLQPGWPLFLLLQIHLRRRANRMLATKQNDWQSSRGLQTHEPSLLCMHYLFWLFILFIWLVPSQVPAAAYLCITWTTIKAPKILYSIRKEQKNLLLLKQHISNKSKDL